MQKTKRKLASVVEIATCEAIPDTLTLSVATIVGKGWRVVTGRGEFKPGDLAVFFEIDSYLPADDERYAFLHERCMRPFVAQDGKVLRTGVRIRSCKLRGVISQGLLMPINMFAGDGAELAVEGGDAPVYRHDGQVVADGFDMTDILHVEHYDHVSEAMRPLLGISDQEDRMGPFPTSYIPCTDEERIQNLVKYFDENKGSDTRFEVTEKCDGESVTVFYSPTVDASTPFGVCGRTIRLKPSTPKGVVHRAWQYVNGHDIERKIRAAVETTGLELAFQGELVGPGIQSNRDRRKEVSWLVFKVWDITNQRYLAPIEARYVCALAHLDYVPVVEEELEVFKVFGSVDELIAYADGKTASGNNREGLVFKTCEEPYASFKAVSNKYLLKNG